MARRHRRKRGKAPGGCYAFWVRKPGAFFGWWLIGRHCGYIGQSSSYARRLKQHLEGDPRWAAKPKDWNDLEPRFFRIPTLFARSEVARLIQETLWIWMLCPVYNIKSQAPWNLRKITGRSAQFQRMMRDNLGLWYKIPRAIMRWGMLATIGGLTIWMTR